MGSGWVHHATSAVNEQSNYPTIIAVCTSLTVFMMIIVCMRCYVRTVILRSVGADDWTIIVSAVCSVIYNSLAIAQSRWGLGLPLALRPKQNTLNYKMLNFTGRPFYIAGITGFKVALCLAYLRIVPPNKSMFKPVIWSVMIACVLAHLASALTLVFQCIPIRKSFYPNMSGHCLPDDKTFYAQAGVTILFDCIIFLLPIPLLARVQINMRRKVALIGVFVLGLFTTVCSIVRMLQILIIQKNGNSTMLVLWGTIEMNVGIVLTCIPTLTPLSRFFRERTTKAGYGPNGYQTGSSYTAEHALENYPSRRPTKSGFKARESGIDDASSQESILGLEGSKVETTELADKGGTMGGITRTTNVDVQISRVEQAHRDSYEREEKWR